MAIYARTVFFPTLEIYPTLSAKGLTLAAKGGIILSASATWVGFTRDASGFFPDASVYFTDVDSGNQSNLGATPTPTTPNNTMQFFIPVPTGGTWNWVNPYRQQIINASRLINKFRFSPSNGMNDQVGVFAGGLSIVAAAEPNVNIVGTTTAVKHGLRFTAELLEFE